MRKFCLILGISTLLLASCSGINNSETTQQTTQENNSNVSQNTSETKQEEKEDGTERNEELGTTERVNVDVPGLVPPTDPDERRREISEGRRDPFALIPLKSDKRIEQPTPVTNDRPVNDNNPVENTKSADLAEGVLITGVITVSGTTQIVLKAPDENFARHVRLGEYVSNGKVLVKAVKQESGSPIVILEQSGIEVRKKLGQEGA